MLVMNVVTNGNFLDCNQFCNKDTDCVLKKRALVFMAITAVSRLKPSTAVKV